MSKQPDPIHSTDHYAGITVIILLILIIMVLMFGDAIDAIGAQETEYERVLTCLDADLAAGSRLFSGKNDLLSADALYLLNQVEGQEAYQGENDNGTIWLGMNEQPVIRWRVINGTPVNGQRPRIEIFYLKSDMSKWYVFLYHNPGQTPCNAYLITEDIATLQAFLAALPGARPLPNQGGRDV
jgi:hypothetical protein